MLFFPYPTIKRLSPVKRKIKFHDGTQNRDIQGENTPKPTLSKPENTKIGESGGKKAGSPGTQKGRILTLSGKEANKREISKEGAERQRAGRPKPPPLRRWRGRGRQRDNKDISLSPAFPLLPAPAPLLRNPPRG